MKIILLEGWSVLLINAGPETFGSLSDICQISVRKMSVTNVRQKTVINLSELYQKTVKCNSAIVCRVHKDFGGAGQGVGGRRGMGLTRDQSRHSL